jgi:Cu-Zn family superoxide dismutase
MTKNKNLMRAALLVAAAAVAAGATAAVGARSDEPVAARASIKNAKGQAVGTARLTSTPNGVLLEADLNGLPAGEHALHVHETGRCEPPQYTSAGDHFSPQRKRHGFLDPEGPHAGDLPNIHVQAAALTIEYLIDGVTLQGGANALLDRDGAAIVVHAEPDDYRTDPAGNGGNRIACGVIEKT